MDTKALRQRLLAINSAVAPLSQCDDEYKERREAAMHQLIGEALDILDRAERPANG